MTLGVGYGYTAGRLTSLTTPSGHVVTYGYDVAGRISGVSVNGTSILSTGVDRCVLSRWCLSMNRLGMLIAACLVAGLTQAGDFCEGSPFVPFGQLLNEKAEHVGDRLVTRGILRTDAQEFTLITDGDTATRGLLVESDDEAEAYARKHALVVDPTFNVIDDFASKLEEEQGGKSSLDMSQIVRYRQQRLLCGRVIRGFFGYAFVIDDSVLEKSFLLPRPIRKRGP